MTHSKKIILALCASLTLLPAIAAAETVSDSTNVRAQLTQEKLRLDAPPTLPIPPKAFDGVNPAVTARMKASTTIASTTRAELKVRMEAEREKVEARKEEIQKQIEETRANIEARREELKKAAEEKRADIKQRLDERRQENIKRFASQMFDRFDAAIARLNTLADRIESRINKLEELGQDVAEYRALLDEGRAKIELAIEAQAAAETSVDEIVISDDPKSSFEKCRGFTKEVVQALKAAHQALVDVIEAMKATQADDSNDTATTTSEE